MFPFGGRSVLYCFVGSLFVVFFDSFFGKGSNLADIGEQVGVKDGFAVHAVESFDVTVLHGPTGLNKLNLNFMFLAPPLKRFGSEFRAVDVSDNSRPATPSDTLSRVLIMRLEDKDVSISIANASRVQTSMTLKVRNLRTPMMLSLIKSMLQI